MTNTNLHEDLFDTGEAIKTLVMALMFLVAGMAVTTSWR